MATSLTPSYLFKTDQLSLMAFSLIPGYLFKIDRLSSRNWSSDDVFEMLQLLGCIRTDKLQQLKNAA